MGAVVAANGRSEAADFNVIRYSREGKGAALVIRKAGRRRGRQGSSGVW